MLGSNLSAVPGAGSEGRTVSQIGSVQPSLFAYGIMRKIPGGLGDWSPIQKNNVFSPLFVANSDQAKFQFTVNQDMRSKWNIVNATLDEITV